VPFFSFGGPVFFFRQSHFFVFPSHPTSHAHFLSPLARFFQYLFFDKIDRLYPLLLLLLACGILLTMSYTPPVYPGAIPTESGLTPDLPDKQDDIDWLYAFWFNAIKKELVAGLTELGVNAKGAAASVSARIAALESTGGGIPAGLIAIWSGLLSAIPSGWALCDGAGGRPNLLDKFVKGVPNNATNPGTTGGSSTVTLAAADIPSHQHSITSGGSHHHHLKQGVDSEEGPNTWAVNGSVDVPTDDAGSHDHGGNTGLIGGGGAHENKPPYYEVAYIIKT